MAKKVLDEMPKETATKVSEKVEKTANVALEEVKDENISTETEKSKKNSKKALTTVIALVVIAIIGCVCFFGYRILFAGDPAKITTKAIRNLKNISADAKKDSNGLADLLLGKDPYEIKTNFKIELPNNMGTYTANAKVQYDAEKESALVVFDAKQGKNTIMSLDALLNDNKFYFKLPDTMKTYYFMDMKDALKEMQADIKNSSQSLDPELVKLMMNYDTDKLIDYLADAVEDNLAKKDFEKSKEEITVNEKEVKATKYTAKITEEKLLNIAKSFIKYASKDKDLIKIMAGVLGVEEKEVLDELKEITSQKIENTEDGYFLYSVYVSTLGETLGYGFEVEDYGSVIITNKKDVTRIEVNYGMYYGSLTIDEKSDDHVVMSLNFMGFVTGELDIKSDIDTVKKNKEYKETNDVKFKLNLMGTEIKAAFKSDSSVKKIDKVDTTNVQGAKDIEKLTTEEQNTFVKQYEKSAFYKTLETFMENQSLTSFGESVSL